MIDVKNNELNESIKKFGDSLVDLTEKYSEKMIRRSDDSVRPFGLKPGECVGFTMKEPVEGELDMYVDVIVKTKDKPATLRISGITLTKDSNGDDVFNSLTLHFTIDEDLAARTVAMNAKAERDDIRKVLHDKKTLVTGIRHSNNFSRNEDSNLKAGNSYDIEVRPTSSELVDTTTNNPVDAEQLYASIDQVLSQF